MVRQEQPAGAFRTFTSACRMSLAADALVWGQRPQIDHLDAIGATQRRAHLLHVALSLRLTAVDGRIYARRHPQLSVSGSRRQPLRNGRRCRRSLTRDQAAESRSRWREHCSRLVPGAHRFAHASVTSEERGQRIITSQVCRQATVSAGRRVEQ